MHLTLDIGNTRTKAHLFHKKALVQQAKWADFSLEQLLSWLGTTKVDALLLSASGHIPNDLAAWFEQQPDAYRLALPMELPIGIDYNTPLTLGADRIAGSVAASFWAKGKACLKIDTGTCTTYDLIDATPAFLGGTIAPGMRLRAQAMHHWSARLPLVTLAQDIELLGKDTTTALQSGVIKAWQQEVLGMVKAYKAKYGLQVCVVTGGDVAFLPKLPIKTITRPELVAEGMQIILSHLLHNTPIHEI